MGLLFCCPSCGTDLRVNPASVALVSCPGCGEAVRVPRRPHPREAAADTPVLPAAVRASVSRGLGFLQVSVWAFVSAAACVLASFLLRVTVGHPSADLYPQWLPPVQMTLAGWWLVLACGGCAARVRGYLLCRPAAERYALGGWLLVATAGAGLATAGVVALVPAVVGRPVITLVPPTAGGFILIGLSAGLIGVLLEFAFLAVLNRVLWEAAGWQAAEHTGRYAVACVFGVVAVMAGLCLGVVALVLTSGGRDAATDAAGVSVTAKAIAVLVILTVGGVGGWLTWRFARLLRVARHAVDTPEPEVASLK